MSSIWVWILAGLLVYTAISVFLDRTGRLPENIGTQGPLTTIRTERGKKSIDRLARRFSTFWRPWGDIGVALGVFVMAMAAAVLTWIGALMLVERPERVTDDPADVLVIPGVNQFLPIEAAPEIVLGLVIALVIHEGGHAIYCRLGDIEIESMGVALLALLPLGAFVEPNYDDQEEAERRDYLRMICAGITNNIVFALLLFALLFFAVSHAFAPVAGVPVGGTYPDTPATDAGIDGGDVIVGINGDEVDDEDELREHLNAAEERSVTVELADGDSVTVDRKVVVTQVTSSGAVAGGELNAGDSITTVDGEEVNTLNEFQKAAETQENIALTTASGEEVSIETGALAIDVGDDGAMADVADGDEFLITHLNGERVTHADDLRNALDAKQPGDTVEVTVIDGDERTHEVVLEDGGDGDATLGVQIAGGVNGVGVTDFGTDTYPAEEIAGLIQGDGGILGFGQYLLIMLFLPLIGAVDPAIGYNFAGFVGDAANFYEVTGPLSILGGGAFVLFNAMFWTAWINIQVGLFNCIPSYPLDGGHLLRELVAEIAERASLPYPEAAGVYAVRATTFLSITALLLMLFL